MHTKADITVKINCKTSFHVFLRQSCRSAVALHLHRYKAWEKSLRFMNVLIPKTVFENYEEDSHSIPRYDTIHFKMFNKPVPKKIKQKRKLCLAFIEHWYVYAKQL